ncbi:hypothetical protein GCM10010404_76700 [Nonomuraea africana]|uniref:MFS transporter n=1 Tax=Nonomuraea africana TaxID=46171 RepID=A0ABR9KPZ1_9ACTN|nr:hypothetical protein [Nonomuraea africana]MBE1564084.1 hypothetical protein [Nonomuraea africana]
MLSGLTVAIQSSAAATVIPWLGVFGAMIALIALLALPGGAPARRETRPLVTADS